MVETYDQRIQRERDARTAREVAEDNAVKALPTLAAEVAVYLGEGWSLDTTHETHSRIVNLVGPDGARLGFGLDWRKPERTTVTGYLPSRSYELLRTEDYKAGQPEISVATDRGVAVIAREITRRIFPAYLPVLAKAHEAITRDANTETARAALVKQIAVEHGLSFGTDRDRGQSNGSDWRSHPGLSVELRLTGNGDSGELTLRGNTAILLAALAAAREAQGK